MPSKVQPITSPVRTLDIHTNLRFKVGDRVKMLDLSEPELFGEVVGHASRDRVWVQWPGNVSQEDVDDLIGYDEWAYTPIPKSMKSGNKKASVNVKASRVTVRELDSGQMIDPFDGQDGVNSADYVGKSGEASPSGHEGVWQVVFDDGKEGSFLESELDFQGDAQASVTAGEDDGYVEWLESLGPDDDTPEADAANYLEEETSNPEACPGCGSMPGDGITEGCNDPNGCGENRLHASTLVASRRQKGIQALRVQAALIRASDLPEEADLIQAAAEVAASIHELEASPETREAASDEVAVTAMQEAIKSTIEATDSLAAKGHTDVASSVTVNLEAALTYPRTAAGRSELPNVGSTPS